MASNTSLFTGLSSLNAHARRLDVISNNIANANTVGFKSSRLMFDSRFSQSLGLGSPPSSEVGGTNPSQVGLGVGIAGTQRNFANGSLQVTGDPRDLAIEGEGLFVVERNGGRFFTRNGAFRPDESDTLVTLGGEKLLGWGVDADFNVIEGDIAPISVPLGKLRIAEATENVSLAGNLNADGQAATQGSRTQLSGTVSEGLRLTSGPLAAAAPSLVLETSLLIDIEDPLQPSTDIPLFADGQVIRVSGARKGGKTLPDVELTVTPATTVAQLLGFLNGALGIHSTATPNPDGREPGASLDPATGLITLTGNTGTANQLTLTSNDVQLINEDGTLARLPFVSAEVADATGEGQRTTMVVYDSLGTPVEVDVSFTLVEKTLGGTTWRYDVQSTDNVGGLHLTSGEVQFDTFGQLTQDIPITVSMSRAGTGAASPLVFEMDLSSSTGRMTALTDTPTEFAAVFRDGLPSGILERFAVAQDGRVQGSFSNGAVRTLGQVVLAQFSNVEGLLDEGSNLFGVGANSGPPSFVQPGAFGSGQIVGGSLELSNVDLGEEFINLIVTQTGYNAASRIIRTTDELMQQLLVLGR
jgi:flagellar hook protein FlgE